MQKLISLLLAVATAGMLHAQNVGIGTTTPTDRLTIQTALNQTGWKHIGGSNSIIVEEAIGAVSASLGTVTNTAFRIKANNAGWLHIYPAGEVTVGDNNTAAFGKFTVQTLNNSYGVAHLGENGNILSTRMGGTSAGICTFSNLNMRLFANSNSALIIDASNGNIGIGTETPAAKLHIGGSMKIDGTNTLEFGVGLSKEQNAGKIGYASITAGTMDIVGAGTNISNRAIKFWNEGGAAFTGNIGIGTDATFGVRLHISQQTEALRLSGDQPYMTFFNGTTFKGYLRNIGASNMELGTAPDNTDGQLNLTIKGVSALSINSTKQVAVNGVPAPYLSPSLTVNGVFSIVHPEAQWTIESANCFSPGGPCLTFYGDGFIRAQLQSDGDLVALSDQSMKKNVHHFRSVLDGVRQLEVSTYEYKNNVADQTSFGLIAQNVQQYFPEVVSCISCKTSEPKLGIAYGKIGVLAVKAIQEQQDIIERQQSKIDVLEKRLAEIEKLLGR